jgi:dihydroorotase
MNTRDRRRFLAGAGAVSALAVSSVVGRAVQAAMGPNDKFDLVIKGGEVLDPSQKLRARRDIGIRYGVVEAVEADIPADRALRVLNAGGKLITPGLIDLHSHVFPYGSAIGIPADELVPFQGTTETAARAVAENADIVIGVKVRMSENVIAKHGLEPLRRAIRACELSGTGGKVMCHIGGVQTRELMSQILNTLRAGDILTHSYSGFPNEAGEGTNIVQDGKLLPAALEAKRRGVVFDVGHGGGSFDYTIAEAAIQQGATPDVISSDIHVFSGNSPGMPYLTWVMSKFLNMGFTLEQVVTMATVNPARVINRAPKLGTLQTGAPGDVTILDVVEGPVRFVDTRKNERDGKVHLRPVQAVVGGVPFGRPYNAPFTVR